MQRIEVNVQTGEAAVIAMTEEEIAEIEARRNTPEALDERRAIRVAQIKEFRDRLRYEGGVSVGGNWFLSTRDAVSEYSALSILAQSMQAAPDYVLRAAWRTMTPGVTVDMTPSLVATILATGFAQVAAIDDRSQTLITQVLASSDPESIDISAGWPSTFPGA